MMNQITESAPNRELGDFLELLRYVCLVQGKRLTINDVCRMAAMSTRTYDRVKRASVQSWASIIGFYVFI